jgi:hypothetical protein
MQIVGIVLGDASVVGVEAHQVVEPVVPRPAGVDEARRGEFTEYQLGLLR